MKFLKNHPFAVSAFFESSVVLTFAVPKAELQPLIPKALQLDTFQDTWGFIAIALVRTKGLRPKGTPDFLGNDFVLCGYRIFVRYTNQEGKRLRGLYIIKSETNKRKMEFFGNIFTHYNYTTTDIQFSEKDGIREIYSKQSDFNFQLVDSETPVELPADSPFADWKEARRFAGPLPFTFTVDEKEGTILIIEGVRQQWIPKPLKVQSYHFKFLQVLKLRGIVLANAFEIKNIPYYWKKGKMESWK